jgi:hypothetical protein
MKNATLDQASEIFKAFMTNSDMLAHIRKDYIKREIDKGNVIYENRVIIIFNKYKHKVKVCDNLIAQKDDIILHQIMNTNEGSGEAGKLLNKFINSFNTDIWLRVRKSNTRAINFYRKFGFKEVGITSWKNNEIQGLVFVKRLIMRML